MPLKRQTVMKSLIHNTSKLLNHNVCVCIRGNHVHVYVCILQGSLVQCESNVSTYKRRSLSHFDSTFSAESHIIPTSGCLSVKYFLRKCLPSC